MYFLWLVLLIGILLVLLWLVVVLLIRLGWRGMFEGFVFSGGPSVDFELERLSWKDRLVVYFD